MIAGIYQARHALERTPGRPPFVRIARPASGGRGWSVEPTGRSRWAPRGELARLRAQGWLFVRPDRAVLDGRRGQGAMSGT